MIPASIPAPKIMLIGGAGSGKTTAIGTLLARYISQGKWEPLETPVMPGGVFHVFTEPSMEILSDIPCSAGYHYHYIPAATPSWAEMANAARLVNTNTYEGLCRMKTFGNKSEYGQWFNFLMAQQNFTCDRCGEEFGDVSSWDNTRALVHDGLSGISDMAMDNVVGGKPIKSQAEWGMAMDTVYRYVKKCCTDTRALYVLVSHEEREPDPITGALKVMAATLGKKLAPKLPKEFSDIIECVHEGVEDFHWSLAADNVETKTRNLPLSSNLPPDFALLMENWRRKHETGD